MKLFENGINIVLQNFVSFDVHLECHWFSLNVNCRKSELCLLVIYEVKRIVTKLGSMTPLRISRSYF